MNEEMLKKAKAAASVEELIELAKAANIELREEKAKQIFDALHAGREVSDEELGNVSGGASVDTCGNFYYDTYGVCDNFTPCHQLSYRGDGVTKACMYCNYKSNSNKCMADSQPGYDPYGASFGPDFDDD